jgi:dihydroflavonol-4-reductase
MRIFVTGAAGPLGRALVMTLRARGDTVVGLVRRRGGVTLMKNLGAESVFGDVRRPEALAHAMKGCDAVVHLAHFFDFWSRHPDTFESVNVAGTKNVVAAALAAKVPRLLFCSSAVTIGEEPGERGFEYTRHRGWTVTSFERTKLEAERVVAHGRTKGLKVVTVNPALVVAPADSGWTGRLFARAVAGRVRWAATAPMGWVWVEDAARGIALALDKGKDGERYILCGETASPKQLLEKVALMTRGPTPQPLPRASSLIASLATAFARPFGWRPLLSIEEERFARTGFRVDGTHARNELGLSYTPSARWLPALVKDYRKAMGRFAA